MELDWTKLQEDVCSHREDVIERLTNFALTDVVLFWSNDEKLFEQQQKKWLPIIDWVNQTINGEFISTIGLDIWQNSTQTLTNLKNYISKLSDRDLAAFYLAAINMRSVLLAIALIKGRINAQQAFELSELEELYQVSSWGKEPVAEARRNSVKQILLQTEKYLN